MKKIFRLVAVVAATTLAVTAFVAPSATAASKVKVGLLMTSADVAISHSTIQQQLDLIELRRSLALLLKK